jgi:hypothetical protein
MDGRPPTPPPSSPEELERARLQTYVDWARVRAPWWLWPALVLAVTAWFVGYGQGPLWGAAGAMIVALVAGIALRVTADRGQVPMPRLRGMPRPLQLAYAPAIAAYAIFLGIAAYALAAGDAPYLLLGLAAGAVLAAGTAWSSRRFRVAADRLIEAEGLRR